jgi:hypothetical protein
MFIEEKRREGMTTSLLYSDGWNPSGYFRISAFGRLSSHYGIATNDLCFAIYYHQEWSSIPLTLLPLKLLGQVSTR